jgi:hypothetical protein
MVKVTEIVDSYVAVWNEPDADERRRRIRAVWAPEGTTCYRLLDARGYDAIEQRVVGSWDKWLREEKYAFRSKSVACHHHVVKIDWVLTAVPAGAVEAAGLSFLILAPDGRIEHDYQFNPTASDAGALAERYVAALNEPDAGGRRSLIADLWAPDAALISETAVRSGHSGIEAEAAARRHAFVAKGFLLSPANASQQHHNVARITWQVRAKDTGTMIAAGSDLLILDDGGRIRFDYRFDEPV